MKDQKASSFEETALTPLITDLISPSTLQLGCQTVETGDPMSYK